MGLERIFGCMEAGTSVFIGTVGASGMPACVRAIGVRSDDDLATATIYLPMATSRETLANLAQPTIWQLWRPGPSSTPLFN